MNLLESLGQGLRGAGGIMDPTVFQGQRQEEAVMQQMMEKRRDMAIQQTIQGVQSGAIDPETGKAALAKLGLDVPVGPSMQAQSAQLDLQKKAKAQAYFSNPRVQELMASDDPKALQVVMRGAVAQGIADPLAFMKELQAESKPTFAPRQSPGYFQQGQFTPTPENVKADTPKPIVEHNFPVQGDKVQPHVSLDGGNTWNPIPGSVPSPKFARQVAPVVNVSAPKQEPLVAVQQEDGTTVYMPRSEAIGKKVGSASTNAQGATAPPEASGLTGEPFLKTLQPSVASTVKAIAEGRVPLTTLSTKGGHREAILALVSQYDPKFEAGKAPARVALQRAFASGPEARNATAINTAIGHMGTMYELGRARNNGDIRVLNSVINRIKLETGNPDITNFEVAKSAVANELMRVFRQVGASQTETADWERKFSNANSPQQIDEAIKTGAELLQSRVNALDDQWKRGMDSEKGYPNLLSPGSAAALAKFRQTRRATDAPSSVRSKADAILQGR